MLELIQDLLALNGEGSGAVKDVTDRFIEIYKDEYKWQTTAKRIGHVTRQKLHLKTWKRHGACAIPASERPKLEQLFEKYGLSVTADAGSPLRTIELLLGGQHSQYPRGPTGVR